MVQRTKFIKMMNVGKNVCKDEKFVCMIALGYGAALLAPTAVNQQKFSFEYVGMNNNRHQVQAKKGISMIGYTQMDLDIAKYHFEVGAGKNNFDWV